MPRMKPEDLESKKISKPAPKPDAEVVVPASSSGATKSKIRFRSSHLCKRFRTKPF